MHVVSGATLERWTALTDEEIVARVVEGQTALYEVLMRRYNERVYRAARSIVKDEDEAEEEDHGEHKSAARPRRATAKKTARRKSAA